MRMRPDTLERYRDTIMQVVHGNNHALLNEDRMDEKQRAGTALLMAAASVSFAAGLIAKTEPHLKNAPMEAQIKDTLELLRDTLTEQRGPSLSVVKSEST